MRKRPIDPAEHGTLQQLHERLHLQTTDIAGAPVPVGDVASAVLGTLNGRLSAREAMLLQEIAGLAGIIEQAKADIASVSVDEIRASHIPSATTELDAIVEHTAIATDGILECCEVLDQLAGSVGAKEAKIIQDVTTRIYEACTFQDITGQRITKVVKALKAIEAKVSSLSYAGHQMGASIIRIASVNDPVSLLNGPMLPQDAMGQDDVDKLLADFG